MVGARTALVVGIDLDPSPSLPKSDRNIFVINPNLNVGFGEGDRHLHRTAFGAMQVRSGGVERHWLRD